MSVSARSTKAVMYSEIEKLRTECDRLRNLVSKPLAPRAQNIAMFCSQYCALNGVRSVPGNVVFAWLSQRASEHASA